MAEETTTNEEREFKVTHDDGSVSLIKGNVAVTDHGVTDENGFPKISTHISMDPTTQTWPAVTPGEENKDEAKKEVK